MGKEDYVSDKYYAAHLSGYQRRLDANPVRDRKAIIQRMLMRQIGEIAVNRFRWINLPKTINPRFLEMTLARNALSVFYYDFELERFLSLRGGVQGGWDMQDDPRQFQVFGNQFTPKSLTTDYCVPIWSNYFRVPDWDIVLIYSSRLAELDVTLEINAKQARRTKIITIDENRRLSYENIVKQIDEGQPAIKVTEDILQDNAIQALDLGVDPNAIINLHMYRMRVWNELMGALGIDNSNQDKKERLVSAEVDANNDQVAAVRFVNLNARLQAVKQINDKFGLDIRVMYQSDATAEEEAQTQTLDNVPPQSLNDYRSNSGELSQQSDPANTKAIEA